MRQQPPHGDDKPDVAKQAPNQSGGVGILACPGQTRMSAPPNEKRQRRQGHDQRAEPLAGQHDAAEVFAQRFGGEIVGAMDAVPLLLFFGRPRLAVEDFVEQRIGGIAGEDPVLAEPQPAAKGCGEHEHHRGPYEPAASHCAPRCSLRSAADVVRRISVRRHAAGKLAR